MPHKALALGAAGALVASLISLQLVVRGDRVSSAASAGRRGPAAPPLDLARIERERGALAGKADTADVVRLRYELEQIKAALVRQGRAAPAPADRAALVIGGDAQERLPLEEQQAAHALR